MEKLLLFLNNFLRDIKKIQFVVLLLSTSIGFAQTITTNKTVTANASNCGIVNVKVDITGANPITRNSDVILAIDISGSMGNTIPGDFKTSMDYAKDAALAFLNQAKANPQNRIAIVAYSTTASLKIGLTYLNAAGVTQITNQINALQATNSTNIYAGIVRSETELETNGRFDCSTARAIILLTDGIANVTGTSGNTSCNVSKTSQCVTDAINAAANAKTTTKSSVVYNNQVFSVGLFGGISGNINTNNSDQNIAKYTLDNIQGSAAYITQSGANLTAIYNQIATQISWVAQSLVAKETIIPGFTISAITTSKGTASLSGQVITWNTDFLNTETITLNYQLTPTGSACGNQTVSTSTLNYQNSTCANDSKAITSPSYFVPCPPVITGALTACGSTTLTATTNAASPSYVWYKDNVVISGQTSATLTATASGVYKVKVKNGTTNCELTSADSTVSISPAAALVAPANANISGCSTAAITGLPYSAASSNITLAQLNSAGGSLSNSGSIGSYTISYSDTAAGTCPTVVTRTFTVTTSCGNVTAIQTISIQDTTAPTWTTAANALNVTLQCSDTAGLNAAQNQAPVATDNCGGTVTYTKTSGSFSAGSCANSGTYTNTWTSKDICNNTSTVFTQVITIQDTTSPTWTTVANSLNVTLQCSDTAGLTAAQNQAPVASDNCGGTVTYTKTSGSFSAGTCANSGTYTNTWTAKDICNNTSTVFTQIITIEDTTAPTWTTAANSLNVTLQCSDTSGLTAAQNQAPVATDNCGGTVTYTKISGSFSAGTCANSGTYTNTWTAKDICNNTSTVFTQIITIQDTTAPTWTTAANALNVTLQCSDTSGLTAAQNQAPVASDNCDGTVTYAKISGSFSAGSCSNSGTYTNTWIAKDVCNNTSTVFTQVITIQDTTAPTWTTAANSLNVTLQCSDTAGLTAAQNQAPIATDNCGGTVTYTKTSGSFSAGSCANSGTYTNTWTAKDVCNNTSTVFTQVITIQDTTAPTWTTAANSLNVTLQCSDTAGLTAAQNQAPTATDNCGGTVTYTKTSGSFSAGSCANSGTYTNTWTAKDVCNNTSTVFTQVITIQDTTAPTWTTAANALNVTLQCSDTAGLTAAQNQTPVASDNCGGTVTYTKVSGTFSAGTCANSGTYTNTWTAKDICNNTSTVFTQVITIQDTTAPTWTTAPNALNVTLQCSDISGLTAAQNQAPIATDNCGGTVTYTKTSGSFSAGSCANSGTYTNTWTAKDICNNTSTVFTQVITIEDTTAPTWTTAPNSLNVTLQCSDTSGLTAAQNQAPIASDNCGGTVTLTKTSGVFSVGSCANSGTYTNTWIAKDICNNTSTIFTQVITIQDTSIPTWTTQSGSLNRTIECSDQQALVSAQALFPTASGACDIDLTNITKVSGQFMASAGCGNAGTYINTWTVKDDCGNTSETFTQVITIQDTTAPTWTTQNSSLNVTLECSDTSGLTSAQALFPTASDLCDADVSNITKISGQFMASEGCSNAGTYTNTWTVKDDCGNTSDTFTQVITIQDTTPPTWTTQTGSLNATLECSDTAGLASAQALFPTASDLCDADVSNITKISGQFMASSGCGNAGTYTNTWTVKDDCDNTSDTFTQIITIQDTTAPTWTTQTGSLNVTLECSDTSGLASAQALFPTASDLCDADVSSITKVSGQFMASEGCSNAGTYTNTWTVKDDCGNTSDIFTQVITIQDTTAPTWTTQNGSLNVTLECSDTTGLASAQALFPTASDLCDADVSSITKVSGQFMASEGCSNAGTYTNTWTVKDDCGNTSDIFTQVITIQDTTAPTWTTQNGSLNVTLECSDTTGLASAQALFPKATDLCDTDVSNITKVSGQFMASEGCSNAGTYTNTWTVKDDCGNTSDTFTQVITIQDTTAPTWTTQNGSLNVTLECSDTAGLASAQALFPTASDLCDADVSSITKISGQFIASEGCGNAGNYTNTWTVKDDCGNTSDTFTQVITIQDTTAPTWTTQNGSLNVTLECSDTAGLASTQALFPKATDLCDADVSNITKVSGQFMASEGCSNAGTYTNTWTVKDDCGNTSDTFTQVITIQDTSSPTFIGELPADITVSCDAVPTPANMEVSDNCKGNLPIVYTETKSDIQNECASNYTLTRNWKTSDCSGNTVSHTQIITVRDTTAPTGTAPSDVAELQSITEIPAGNVQDIKDAADNCSSNVSITISDTNNEGSGCQGSPYILTRTYTLADCAGNKTELVQTFTVENKVSVSGIATNTTCLGGKDGSILVTSSPGSTVVITNDKNEVVGNTNLPAGTYTLTASSPVNENQNCTAKATVIITEPSYTVKISGQVINVDTHTGIANVPITLIPQSPTTGPVLLHLTAADGSYSFSGMPAGNYLVQVQDANLNSAYQLYPVNSSLFFTTLEDCKIQKHDFEYGASTLPVLGDYVWYDTNSNGIQDEWYDANNDGIVTKNIADSNGAIDYSLWEWIDLNGDGSYTGPLNAGELNAGGFGNAANANVIIDGPNGYHQEVIVGIAGFWRDRPNSQNPYGEYKIKLVREANFDAVASALGATGLVKVLPSVTDKKITSKTSKSQTHIVCSTTTESGYIVNITPEDLVHLDIDFGVSCKTYLDIVANDDNAGPIAGVNNITHNVINVLTNDTLEGAPITSSQVIITTVTPNEFLQLNPDGSVDVLPNAPTGTLTLVYQICEADQTSNCDTATVTITIEAPVMTVTATSICVNDVPYIDYVVTPVNFTPVNGVTIAWANAQNTVITTMTNLPLSGRVLWPGALVDENGKGIDWPGWIFENNKWIQGSDGFESLRPTVNITVSVNPSETITVNYPPADPYCTARPTFAIVANDDTPAPITGPAGVINIVNVLNNDTLNNSAINPIDITLTTVTPDPKGVLTLNPDGSVDVAANAPGGTYTLVYQICEKADAGNCDTAIVTVTVLDSQVNANDDNYVNIGCNTFGLVGNVLSNDLKGQLPATLKLVTFTLLNENNNAAKTDPNITIDASGNVTVSSLTPAGTYTYMYRICGKQNSENCDTATVTITVVPNGTTNITSKACNDDTTLLNLSDLLPEGTPLTGSWLDTSNSRALQGNILNAYGLALGSYTFEYKIVNENCPRSILLTMEINDDCKVLACQSILIHNAFSPNGDGKNDFFVIDGIDDLTCYPENTVEIYNRWGILVFETNNYNNTTNAFDGTSRGRTTIQQSDGLPTGTYFYIVTYKSLDGNNVIQNNKKEGYLYLSK